MSNQARSELDAIVVALNGSVAGLSIFAGTDTDTLPLADSTSLLADLAVVVGGATTAAGVRAAAQTWFDDPFGFDAAVYTGSTNSLNPVEVSPGENVAMNLRANDPVFRDLMMNTALAALAADPAIGFDATTQNELLLSSGEALLATQDALSAVRGELGFAQSRIDQAQARNAATSAGLQASRTTLLEADPFETAIRLEDAQFRLESLYQLTARTSQLSLVNFLR